MKIQIIVFKIFILLSYSSAFGLPWEERAQVDFGRSEYYTNPIYDPYFGGGPNRHNYQSGQQDLPSKYNLIYSVHRCSPIEFNPFSNFGAWEYPQDSSLSRNLCMGIENRQGALRVVLNPHPERHDIAISDVKLHLAVPTPFSFSWKKYLSKDGPEEEWTYETKDRIDEDVKAEVYIELFEAGGCSSNVGVFYSTGSKTKTLILKAKNLIGNFTQAYISCSTPIKYLEYLGSALASSEDGVYSNSMFSNFIFVTKIEFQRISYKRDPGTIGDEEPVPESSPTGGIDTPRKSIICPGSILNMDNLSFGESIPVVGTPITLEYSTESKAAFLTQYSNIGTHPSFAPEGWSISLVHFYKVNEQRLFKGSGGVVKKIGIPRASNIMVVEGDEVYVFSSEGRHIETRTALTGALKFYFQYNTEGYLTSISDVYGRTTAFSRDVNNVLTAITSHYGQVTNIQTNNNGLISRVTNPMNEFYQMSYNSQSLLISEFIKPSGRKTNIQYDQNGKMLSTRKDQGQGYNFISKVIENSTDIKMTSALGLVSRVKAFRYFDGSYSRSLRRASGDFSTYKELDNGSYTAVNSVMQKDVTLSSDSRYGHLRPMPAIVTEVIENKRRQINISNSVTGFSSDPFTFSSLETLITKDSNIWRTIFDRSTRLLTTISPKGAVRKVKLDEYDRVIEVQNAQDTPYNFEYNSSGQVVETRQGLRNKKTYTYSSQGYLSSIRDALGNENTFAYDLAGRLKTSVKSGDITTYSYDKDGLIASISPPGKLPHNFRYNSVGDISSYRPPFPLGFSQKNTLYEYNTDGQLTRVIRPNQEPVNYSYSYVTGLLQSIGNQSTSQKYKYRRDSDLIDTVTSFDGISSSYLYFGGEISSERQKVVGNRDYETLVEFSFDNLFRRSKRLIRADFLPEGRSTVNMIYDIDDSLKKVGDLTFSYESQSGRLSSSALYSVVERYQYDSFGALTSYQAEYLGTILYSYSLIRDNTGRVIGKTETVSGVSNSYSYKFDSIGRLAEVYRNGTLESSYEYDSNGNRTNSYIHGANITATYDSQDRLLSYGNNVYKYNANGDLIVLQRGVEKELALTWDLLGRLHSYTTSKGDLVQYTLDSSGRRVIQRENSKVRYRNLFESTLKMAAQYDESQVSVKEFVYGNSLNSPEYMKYKGRNFRFIKDHLGSIKMVVDAETGIVLQRLEYDVWGRILKDSNKGFQPFGFAGGVFDDKTKFVRFGARDYDPEVGRWTSKDPILFNGGDTNLFGYVQNDPVNWTDPSGLMAPGQSMMCPEGSCGGNSRDQYLSGVQMNRQELAQQDSFVKGAIVAAGAAAIAPTAAIAISNACLSNAALCVELVVAAASGFGQGYTGDQLPFSPYGSVAEPVVEIISNGVGSVCP